MMTFDLPGVLVVCVALICAAWTCQALSRVAIAYIRTPR